MVATGGACPRTARELAHALLDALGIGPFGELTIKVADGRITTVRQTQTLTEADLEGLPRGAEG